MGISSTDMLTGDKEPIAKDVAEKAGVDTVFAKLMPADKVERVAEAAKAGCKGALYR